LQSEPILSFTILVVRPARVTTYLDIVLEEERVTRLAERPSHLRSGTEFLT
jgi:hypothetical protein